MNTETARPKFIKEDEVLAMVALGTTTLRARIAAGEFPAPIQIGKMRAHGRPGAIVWLESEVIDWMAQQARDMRVSWANKRPAGAQVEA